MPTILRLIPAILAMVAIVAASNVLVQYPVQFQLGAVNLADLLTWGAFTYPVAFLVTDLTNRRFGPARARRVVLVGFAVAVVLSAVLATPRIAIASGTAFLCAQLLDVVIFDRLRQGRWWRAPLVSSLVASALDTAIFFSIAFSAGFAFIDGWFGTPDGSLTFPAPFLGVGAEVELWMSLASGDFLVKLLIALAMLVPYGALLALIRDRAPAKAAPAGLNRG